MYVCVRPTPESIQLRGTMPSWWPNRPWWYCTWSVAVPGLVSSELRKQYTIASLAVGTYARRRQHWDCSAGEDYGARRAKCPRVAVYLCVVRFLFLCINPACMKRKTNAIVNHQQNKCDMQNARATKMFKANLLVRPREIHMWDATALLLVLMYTVGPSRLIKFIMSITLSLESLIRFDSLLLRSTYTYVDTKMVLGTRR